MRKKVLILEDDLRLAKSLEQDFLDHGYGVFLAQTIAALENNSEFTDAVIDLRLSNGEFGLDAIDLLKQATKDIRIVVLSGYGSITTAVEAVKRGATDYLTKPASFVEIVQALNGQRVAGTSEFHRRSLSEVEHEYIDFVLTKNEGNISQTAKDLGLHRQSLQRKLKKYT
jgi:two-component system response regulator RegA